MNTSHIKYGGKIYEDMARKLTPNDIVIKNFDECLFSNKKKKNIAIIHHLDYSQASLLIRIIYFFIKPIILYNLKKFDAIVVVSKYWEKYFTDRGYNNVYLIYNAFDVDKFVFTDEEIKEFKQRHNLTKPIIYLGNCQKAKGVVEVYEQLKDLDVHLITSGKQQVKLSVRNLDLDNRDYLRLLKASDIVITMSLFKEGWCRTAHEAMLCKTSVIGSGEGGMEELLEGGRQTMSDFYSLLINVDYLLGYQRIRKVVSNNGYDFAKQFTIERFKKDWLILIKKI